MDFAPFPFSKQQRRLAAILLWLAFCLLIAGIGLPLIAVEKFFIFENRVSIYSGTVALFAQGEWFLAVILLTFSIVFPLAKNLLMLALLHGVPAVEKRLIAVLRSLAVLGKWSMLDVFIVAVLVCSIKLGLLANTEVLAGVYFFAASVLLTNAVSTWLEWRYKAVLATSQVISRD